MVIQNDKVFEELSQQLRSHLSHKVSLANYGDTLASDWIGVECHDCRQVLIEFLPACGAETLNPKNVRYEGHYDEVRDVRYIDVFKPGKAPYPLQERQDIINHSPTGISWGYGGSGPAQCALAILLDYLGDEEKAKAHYQNFKFAVIARLPQNSGWTLSGLQIEHSLRLFAS